MRRAIPLKHKLGASAMAAVLVLTLVHLYTNVLGGSVGSRPLHIDVALTDTGGLFQGSGVAYRGVRVGSVSAIDLADGGVRADISLNPGAKVPADTRAVVRTLSPAGEQFLDLQPRRDGAPYLADGDRIAASETSIPTSVADTLAAIDSLMGQIDTKKLRTVMNELNLAFSDPDDLGRVITSGNQLLDTLDATWPETLRTMQNGRTVLRTGVDTADEFQQFATSARSLTAWLKGYDPKLRSTLEVTPGQLAELQRFADDMVRALPPLLRDFAGLTDVFARRDPHLRELLIQFPLGLDGLVGAFAGGRMQTNMLVSDGEVCSYGVDDSNPQLGVADRQPLDPDRSCPASFAGQQRGSAHAPGPTR
jgi:phospholipid/cholesterol/gamma-HCH transport system substrate-binding protein